MSEEAEERNPSGEAERPQDGAKTPDAGEVRERPDVFLDVPELEIEELDLEVEDLRAQIAVNAELPNMVRLNVGVEAVLGTVKLGIKGLEAQVQLTVHLDNIRSILEGVLEAADRNPKILEGLTRAAEATAVAPAGDEPAGSSGDPEAGAPSSEPTEAAEAAEVAETDEQDGARASSAQADGAQATDGARKRAQELGVELPGLRGTGRGGRVTVRDVEKAARGAASG